MKKRKGFTLSEALIGLAIVGVISSLYIPSIVVDTRQKEYKTSLRKAVHTLNNAISLNTVLDNESPNFNSNLFGYLQKHMFIYKSTTQLSFSNRNYAFYTMDGIRFEFPTSSSDFNYSGFHLYESSETIDWNNYTRPKRGKVISPPEYFGHCGSKGLPFSPDDMYDYPCMIMVDVNGDKKPNPAVVKEGAITFNEYTFAYPGEKLFKDVFTIMITDKMAIPYGVMTQKALYDRNIERAR